MEARYTSVWVASVAASTASGLSVNMDGVYENGVLLSPRRSTNGTENRAWANWKRPAVPVML